MAQRNEANLRQHAIAFIDANVFDTTGARPFGADGSIQFNSYFIVDASHALEGWSNQIANPLVTIATQTNSFYSVRFAFLSLGFINDDAHTPDLSYFLLYQFLARRRQTEIAAAHDISAHDFTQEDVALTSSQLLTMVRHFGFNTSEDHAR